MEWAFMGLLKSVVVGLTACASLAVGAVGLAPSASAQSSFVCSYTNSQPTLNYGSTGTAVKQAQCEINWSLRNNKPSYYTSPITRYPLTLDGIFGGDTRTQVHHFQSFAGISSDGIVGPQTWAALNYYALRSVVGGFPKG